MLRLFVYGSLRRGGRHHDELRGARFLGEATTEPGYALEPLGEYLALVAVPAGARPGEAGGAGGEGGAGGAGGAGLGPRDTETAPRDTVPGELYEIAVGDLPRLDDFEGDGYFRGEVGVVMPEGRGISTALAYFKKPR